MACLVALPMVADPARRPACPHPRSRRGGTLAALPRRCRCGRRHLLGASSAAGLLHLVTTPSPAASPIAPNVMLERVYPARPEWYEKLFAAAMDKGMESYEAEIAKYKSVLFAQLTAAGKNILELGVGTGPNLNYYANADGVNIVGVDPNMYMEEYFRAAAISSGLPASNFTFRRGVAEALPVEDGSMDAVIGTLVLCSVTDMDTALREIKRVLKPGGLYLFIEHVAAPDASFLRFVQGALDPLQQLLSDGCHLTRKTGENIKQAGFSSLNTDTAQLSKTFIISPHIYGVAYK